MPLERQPIVSLLNGVSQQPASQRHPTQAEEQVNLLSSLSSGLEKRPPTQHLENLMTAPTDEPFVHSYIRDATEKYLIVIADGDLKVFDMTDGSEATVNFPDGKGYLTSTADAREAFVAATFGDVTFIANKETTVLMDATLSPGTVSGTYQSFSALPASPATGTIYKVAGDADNDFDDYYVEYDGSVYIETDKPGIEYAFDLSTMPHSLVNTGPGTFDFEEYAWGSRTAGDESSAQEPAFVDDTIDDVFFFRNRLGLLSGESVVLSRTNNAPGGYSQFWPESVQAVLDTDPIDMSVPQARVSRLYYAVPFDRALLIFSRVGQFQLSSGEGALTPRSARIDPTTAFEILTDARPVGVGQDLYFATDQGDHAGIREYFVEDLISTNNANDVTSHIPRYIPAGVHHLTGSTNENLLATLTTGTAARVYVYKFYWSGDEKTQAAWSYWELDTGAQVWYATFDGPRLYLVVQRSDGLFLEYMDFNSDPTATDLGIVVHLDRRVELTGSYDAGADETTWTLPYQTSETLDVVLSGAFGVLKGTQPPTLTQPTSTTVVAEGDYSASMAYVGIPYTATYTFSEQFLRTDSRSASGASTAILGGRLQLASMDVRYDRSGYFYSEVSGSGRDTSTSLMAQPIAADAETTFDPAEVLHSGTHAFSIRGRSSDVTIKLENDSWLPSRWLSAQWTGRYSGRRTPH